MRTLLLFSSLLVTLFVSCTSKGINKVTSPDRKLIITFKDTESHGNALEWVNSYRFYYKGQWHESVAPALYSSSILENNNENRSQEQMEKLVEPELETGIRPIRIDQLPVIDDSPIYLVYSLTYSDPVYHEYLYSYAALCIKDGALLRYPLFEGVMNEQEMYSDIITISPSSIELDFTMQPLSYEYEIDRKIVDTPEDKRIIYDDQTGLIVIGEVLKLNINRSLL